MQTDRELLEAAALDEAVAIALGYRHMGAIGTDKRNSDGIPWCLSGCNDWWKDPEGHMICAPCCGFPKQYSSEWGLAGPIIEREKLTIKPRLVCGEWHGEWRAVALSWEGRDYADCTGPTPLVAAMRAYVCSRQPAAQIGEVQP